MEVHRSISKHSESQHKRISLFRSLDAQRELAIEDAVRKCQNGEEFSIEAINAVTAEINELANQGIVPTRKLVTKDMIQQYVEKL
ncbi:DUF2533 family protein [Bacillus taeanensis]|uniref:DUF2533 domain-containing protein n=1 Tax=Bacillus taeanensis TaxID=273032 RepID=A0A366XRE9_9BACI|nr:DUF2533 family protein [Bacillus taeanensis]RBW68712.1 DUF2533 domain-containing protein [Bacillus taeanensis]